MWRRILGLTLLTLASATVGAAASATVSSDSVGAASIAVPRCTNVGLSVLQNLSAGTVVSITVSGLPASCGGATLQATVNNGLTSGTGSTVVPAGGGMATVTLGVAVAVTVAEQTDIVLVGP